MSIDLEALEAQIKRGDLWLLERHSDSDWPRQNELAELIRLARQAQAAQQAPAQTMGQRVNAALLQSQPAQGQWQPIDSAPKDETAVILYFANRIWKALDDSICPPDPVRDLAERTEIGFYRDGMWCETGTAHDYFEPWNESDDQPTHWCPLPDGPIDAAIKSVGGDAPRDEKEQG